jgi:hypothetical protein
MSTEYAAVIPDETLYRQPSDIPHYNGEALRPESANLISILAAPSYTRHSVRFWLARRDTTSELLQRDRMWLAAKFLSLHPSPQMRTLLEI